MRHGEPEGSMLIQHVVQTLISVIRRTLQDICDWNIGFFLEGKFCSEKDGHAPWSDQRDVKNETLKQKNSIRTHGTSSCSWQRHYRSRTKSLWIQMPLFSWVRVRLAKEHLVILVCCIEGTWSNHAASQAEMLYIGSCEQTKKQFPKQISKYNDRQFEWCGSNW